MPASMCAWQINPALIRQFVTTLPSHRPRARLILYRHRGPKEWNPDAKPPLSALLSGAGLSRLHLRDFHTDEGLAILRGNRLIAWSYI